MPSVTVEDLNNLVAIINHKEEAAEKVQEQLAAMNKEIASLYSKATGYLEELGQDSFSTPYGSLEIITKRQVRIPQTEEDKLKLFEWMKEREIFNRYATVNSVSLQALYKAEYAEAEKQGEDMMIWSIPGIQPAQLYRTTKIRKSKKLKTKESEDEQE